MADQLEDHEDNCLPDYLEHDDGFDDEAEEECGLMPDGQCALAGTEHCDWECGRLNEQRIAAMKAAQTKPI